LFVARVAPPISGCWVSFVWVHPGIAARLKSSQQEKNDNVLNLDPLLSIENVNPRFLMIALYFVVHLEKYK
jgi:hypothetical protein